MSTAPAGTPGAPPDRREALRIVASMTATCALGAALLGGVYIATERYAEEARARREREAVTDLLQLSPGASVLEIAQYLSRDGKEVIYRAAGADGEAPPVELAFALDGTLLRRSGNDAAAVGTTDGLRPLGRLFVARRGGSLAGFVAEGESRGYKNRIRFFVGLTPSWEVAGVRVIEHEEDPGLGAEVATVWFEGQFTGRPAASMAGLDVTRDPMPEDWRGALRQRSRIDPEVWNARYGELRAREAARPIYAVTGATISSRALTDGVRTAIQHFQKRWALLEPNLEGANWGASAGEAR